MDNWNNNYESQNGSYSQPYQNNGQYNQNSGQYTQYNETPPYKPDKNAPETEEEKRKGNFFSGLSLACTIGSKVLSSIIAAIMNAFNYSSEILDNPLTRGVGALIAGILGMAEFAGFILMIYVRVKYPKNTFGKVLMWLYIVYFIIMIVIAVLAIVACVSCVNGLSNCPG